MDLQCILGGAKAQKPFFATNIVLFKRQNNNELQWITMEHHGFVGDERDSEPCALRHKVEMIRTMNATVCELGWLKLGLNLGLKCV